MPKRAKELSPIQVRRLTEPGRHAVGGVNGLYLDVGKTDSSRSWLLRVMAGGRRRDLGLGSFPTVTLEQARDKARIKRAMIEDGVDPVQERAAARAALRTAQAKSLTFGDAADRCHKAKASEYKQGRYGAHDWLRAVTEYAGPIIGTMPVAEVDLPHIVRVLEPLWTTKHETGKRLRGRIETILDWATVSGFRSGVNPARWKGNLQHVLAKPSKIKRKDKHYKAVPWQDMPTFMGALRARTSMSARCLEFLILTTARSIEGRQATWSEIDLKAKLWTVPAERMKRGLEHRVPLPAAALTLLRALPRHDTSPLVFYGTKGQPLSDMAPLQVMRKMHVDATPHGTARSSFKDWCRSVTKGYADEVSELQLAHVSTDATRAAYARDELLPLRRKLMQEWSAYCASKPKRKR